MRLGWWVVVVACATSSACGEAANTSGQCSTARHYPNQCASRTATWQALLNDCATMVRFYDAGPGAAGAGQTCPEFELVQVCFSALNLSGESIEAGPTYDAATDSCCYDTVGGLCL